MSLTMQPISISSKYRILTNWTARDYDTFLYLISISLFFTGMLSLPHPYQPPSILSSILLKAFFIFVIPDFPLALVSRFRLSKGRLHEAHVFVRLPLCCSSHVTPHSSSSMQVVTCTLIASKDNPIRERAGNPSRV